MAREGLYNILIQFCRNVEDTGRRPGDGQKHRSREEDQAQGTLHLGADRCGE
jgi:hypothetical protein